MKNRKKIEKVAKKIYNLAKKYELMIYSKTVYDDNELNITIKTKDKKS